MNRSVLEIADTPGAFAHTRRSYAEFLPWVTMDAVEMKPDYSLHSNAYLYELRVCLKDVFLRLQQ